MRTPGSELAGALAGALGEANCAAWICDDSHFGAKIIAPVGPEQPVAVLLRSWGCGLGAFREVFGTKVGGFPLLTRCDFVLARKEAKLSESA